LKSLADVIHRQDNEYGGGGAVRELARGAIMWGASLLPVPCPEALRPELLASVARLGIVVGASQFDAYAHDDARVSFRLAAECAEEAGEWHLRAKTYSFMARHEIWVGDPDTGLTHATVPRTSRPMPAPPTTAAPTEPPRSRVTPPRRRR
jgi:hypothetical protein